MVRNIAAYAFVRIADPTALAAALHERAEALALKGSVLVAGEGLNLFLAGEGAAIEAFLATLRADPRFADMPVKASESAHVPFARLKVKVKGEIIAFRREDASPLDARAPAVSPATLARWIGQGCDDAGRRLVLLDTRNREETAHGAFDGALLLQIDNFTDLPTALEPHCDALYDATVVSYCTGGIRCEKAALWMRAQGMDNVVQLDGGILGYFEHIGGTGYSGRCFVFDERVALDAELRPLFDAPVSAENARSASDSSCRRKLEKVHTAPQRSSSASTSAVAHQDQDGPRFALGRQRLLNGGGASRTSSLGAERSLTTHPLALSPQSSRGSRA